MVHAVAMVEVEQSEVGEIGRHFGQAAARLDEHRRNGGEVGAQALEPFARRRHLAEGDAKQRIEVEAGIAPPRPKHLQVEPVAVDQAAHREPIDLALARPAGDVHRVEAALVGGEPGKLGRHPRLGIILADPSPRFEHHAGGEGGDHIGAELGVEPEQILIAAGAARQAGRRRLALLGVGRNGEHESGGDAGEQAHKGSPGGSSHSGGRGRRVKAARVERRAFISALPDHGPALSLR